MELIFQFERLHMTSYYLLNKQTKNLLPVRSLDYLRKLFCLHEISKTVSDKDTQLLWIIDI